MRVESPSPGETEAIADLWVALAREQQCHGARLAAEPNRDAVAETVARAVVADGVRVARAEEDDDAPAGELLGFVMFGPDTSGLETTMTGGTVENVYVRPSFREQGIGSALLEAAEEALAARGVDVVELEALAANEAARRFYRRHGYEPHRVRMDRTLESDTHSRDAE
ncbi:MAG: GNAT family N-acetyltransferase [Halorientalis sp.]